MTLKGKGRAILKIGLEYTDNKKNKYRSPTATIITLDIRQKVFEEIPINGLRSTVSSALFVAAEH
jgi:hypothetical protein